VEFAPEPGALPSQSHSQGIQAALTSTVDFFINAQWERYRLAVHPLVHRENCGDL
jgi:hypothetical protein